MFMMMVLMQGMVVTGLVTVERAAISVGTVHPHTTVLRCVAPLHCTLGPVAFLRLALYASASYYIQQLLNIFKRSTS
jgi:hypothetical protein